MKVLNKRNNDASVLTDNDLWTEPGLATFEKLFNGLIPDSYCLTSKRGQSVYEDEDGTTLNLDLPGVSKDDVSVTLDIEGRNSVIIKTKRIVTEGATFTNINLSDLEKSFKFKVKHNIDENGIDATLKDGVLTIVVKKAVIPEGRKIEVK